MPACYWQKSRRFTECLRFAAKNEAMPFRTLATAVLAAALAGCSLFAADPLAQAEEAMARQDFVAARDALQGALERDAQDAAALELLARAQLALGQGAEVIATLDRLAAARALPADAALLRAEALLQTGEIDAALALLAGRRDAESWRLRATAAGLRGDDAGVREAFAQGRGAEGDRRKLLTAEATWHLDRGDAAGARAAVGAVQQLAPDSIETLSVSARLAYLMGEPGLAARAYFAILEKSPTDRPALLGAIASTRTIGRMDLAADLVARGRSAFPGDIAFIYHTALLDADAGNWQAVRSRLQADEGKVADFAPARLLYGQAMLELGQVEQARALVGPLVGDQPDDPVTRQTWERIVAAG